MNVEEAQLPLADTVVGETMLFLKAFDDMGEGQLTLEQVNESIDRLAFGIQALDMARSSPENWAEIAPGQISSYDYLWPCEQILLFILANYAAIHAAFVRDTECPLISPRSLAWEVLTLEWLPFEMGNEELLKMLLAHPAAQVPQDE